MKSSPLTPMIEIEEYTNNIGLTLLIAKSKQICTRQIADKIRTLKIQLNDLPLHEDRINLIKKEFYQVSKELISNVREHNLLDELQTFTNIGEEIDEIFVGEQEIEDEVLRKKLLEYKNETFFEQFKNFQKLDFEKLDSILNDNIEPLSLSTFLEDLVKINPEQNNKVSDETIIKWLNRSLKSDFDIEANYLYINDTHLLNHLIVHPGLHQFIQKLLDPSYLSQQINELEEKRISKEKELKQKNLIGNSRFIVSKKDVKYYVSEVMYILESLDHEKIFFERVTLFNYYLYLKDFINNNNDYIELSDDETEEVKILTTRKVAILEIMGVLDNIKEMHELQDWEPVGIEISRILKTNQKTTKRIVQAIKSDNGRNNPFKSTCNSATYRLIQELKKVLQPK